LSTGGMGIVPGWRAPDLAGPFFPAVGHDAGPKQIRPNAEHARATARRL